MTSKSIIFYSIDDKLIKKASKFIILKKHIQERNEFKKITPSYINGVNEICNALQEEFPEVKFDFPVLAVILYELGCDFNAQKSLSNQISKIAPSLVKGTSQLDQIIETFKKHPANISAISFYVRDKKNQYDANANEKIISNLKEKKSYNDNVIKIEGFEFIDIILKFMIKNQKQFKGFSGRETEILHPKFKKFASSKVDAKFRKMSSKIINNFLEVTFPNTTKNYRIILGGKLQALINLMPAHSSSKHTTKKMQDEYYRSMFKKDLQLFTQ